MGKETSDFRYNTGDTKVPWAAVGENYNADDVMELVNKVIHGSNSFKVVTNLDDFPITYGDGGNGLARTIKN